MKKIINKFLLKQNNIKNICLLLLTFLGFIISSNIFPEENMIKTAILFLTISINIYSISYLLYMFKYTKILHNPVHELVLEIEDKKFQDIGEVTSP